MSEFSNTNNTTNTDQAEHFSAQGTNITQSSENEATIQKIATIDKPTNENKKPSQNSGKRILHLSNFEKSKNLPY